MTEKEITKNHSKFESIRFNVPWKFALLFLVLYFSITLIPWPKTPLVTNIHNDENFLQCISLQQKPSNFTTIPIYSPNNSSYSTILNSSTRNLRFLSSTSLKPLYIITPLHESHVQATVICCRKHGLALKVRSGGHDVEGFSYTSDVPFVLIDLANYRNITVDVIDKSAWIQTGAQIGDVYYRIGEKTKTLGFPAGMCPTVGVAGHFSGGGFGTLVRKYGLSSDHILDARIVNANGEILDKKSMGEDLFWALRGGGANSFGVVLSWKVRLVPVTNIVTISTKRINLNQNATDKIYKWQQIADKLPEDIYIAVRINVEDSGKKDDKKLLFEFMIVCLGNIDKVLQITQEYFPQLGLQRKDCNETSWVESHVHFFAGPGGSLEVLLNRNTLVKNFSKMKSDFITKPISKDGLDKIWSKVIEGHNGNGKFEMFWAPLGGRMNEISEFETPYPHRAGNIFNAGYVRSWDDERKSEENMDWIRKFYSFMTPYVSKFPIIAHLNYKDVDLGDNKDGVWKSYSTWGFKYFKHNFYRLVYVKKMVDPHNFFYNKQSIPLF